jgi:hypothetical protein
MHLHPSSRGSIPALGALAPPPEAADPDRERSVGRLSSYLRPPQDSVGISSSRGILAPLVVRGDTRPCPADPSPSSSSKAAAAVMLVSPLKDRPKPVSTMPIEIPNRKLIYLLRYIIYKTAYSNTSLTRQAYYRHTNFE